RHTHMLRFLVCAPKCGWIENFKKSLKRAAHPREDPRLPQRQNPLARSILQRAQLLLERIRTLVSVFVSVCVSVFVFVLVFVSVFVSVFVCVCVCVQSGS